jgi:hypothetical protein
MMNFLELASAVSALYQYFDDEPKESDFTHFSDENYQQLSPNEQNQQWFIVQDRILKKEITNPNTALIVNEKEKHCIFNAVQLLQNYTKELPDSATFKERLLYAKKALPPILCSSDTEKNKNCRIIPFKKTFN